MQAAIAHHTLHTGTVGTVVIALIVTQFHCGKLIGPTRLCLYLVPLLQFVEPHVKWCTVGLVHALHKSGLRNVRFDILYNQAFWALGLLFVASLTVILIVELLQTLTIYTVSRLHVGDKMSERLLRAGVLTATRRSDDQAIDP